MQLANSLARTSRLSSRTCICFFAVRDLQLMVLLGRSVSILLAYREKPLQAGTFGSVLYRPFFLTSADEVKTLNPTRRKQCQSKIQKKCF